MSSFPTTLVIADPQAVHSNADALVLAAYADDGPRLVGDFLDAETAERVCQAARLVGFDASALTTTTLPGQGLVSAKRIVLVGLGEEDRISTERVREAAGVVGRSVAGMDHVIVTLPELDLAATVEGLLLGSYQFDRYKRMSRPPVSRASLVVTSPVDADETLKHAQHIAHAVCWARDLVNISPVDLAPQDFVAEAQKEADRVGVRTEILDEVALREQGFGGIVAVGSGSSRPPRLLRLHYAPQRSVARVALVGKGITFDSGGLALKTVPGMERMTLDMAGAAAVAAATFAIAALQLPITVTATVALAENMPSGTAYRPGDVISHYAPAGQRRVTSHVLNTDAEGRLVLADAVVRACEDGPKYLLETSTLTSPVLGPRAMAVMGSEQLRDRVAEIGRERGEDGWALPLPESLRESLWSDLADIQNMSTRRGAETVIGGHYLAHFVAEGVEWAHLDIVGAAYNDDDAHGYTPRGGTGVPARTLISTVEQLAAQAKS